MENQSKTVLFTIPGSPPIVAKLLKQETDYITAEYPIVFLKEDSHIYTIPYMPLAKNGIVLFSNQNILSISAIDDEILTEYELLVAKFKQQPKYVRPSDDESTKLKKIINKKVLH
jgi:hypothetical protein